MTSHPQESFRHQETLRQNKSESLAFPTQLRPTVQIDVNDLDSSIRFYQAVFNRPATEISDNNARFNPYNPPMDFQLIKRSNAQQRDGHFGIQLKSSEDIQRYKSRLESAGFDVELEESETACCFSVANKAWLNDPDGNQWEIFVVTEENTSEVRCGDSCACEAEGCG